MGLLRMATRTAVVAGTATAVSGRVQRRQANRYAGQDAQEGPPAPDQQATAEPQDEQVAKLEDLARLHEQGVLSDDEFAAAKAKVLGI